MSSCACCSTSSSARAAAFSSHRLPQTPWASCKPSRPALSSACCSWSCSTGPSRPDKIAETEASPPKLVQNNRLELARCTQETLRVQGLYTGKLDGTIGAKTRAVIGRWQEHNGSHRTGEITETQIGILEQEAVTRLAKKDSRVSRMVRRMSCSLFSLLRQRMLCRAAIHPIFLFRLNLSVDR